MKLKSSKEIPLFVHYGVDDKLATNYLFGKHELTIENHISFINKEGQEVFCHYNYSQEPYVAYVLVYNIKQVLVRFDRLTKLKHWIQENIRNK